NKKNSGRRGETPPGRLTIRSSSSPGLTGRSSSRPGPGDVDARTVKALTPKTAAATARGSSSTFLIQRENFSASKTSRAAKAAAAPAGAGGEAMSRTFKVLLQISYSP